MNFFHKSRTAVAVGTSGNSTRSRAAKISMQVVNRNPWFIAGLLTMGLMGCTDSFMTAAEVFQEPDGTSAALNLPFFATHVYATPNGKWAIVREDQSDTI